MHHSVLERTASTQLYQGTKAETAGQNTGSIDQGGNRRKRWQKWQKSKSSPPTHFLAVPLTADASVAAAITAVQASLAAHDPLLSQACTALCTAHITLAVLHLPTGGQLACSTMTG